MASEKTPGFQALPYGDRWRITRLLAKGEAPRDPRMAAVAVELAESFQARGRAYASFIRWLPIVVIVACGAAAIFFTVDGDTRSAILNAAIVLVNIAQLALNPMARPKSVARSLEASRRVVASGSNSWI
jgi:hypothetical protein